MVFLSYHNPGPNTIRNRIAEAERLRDEGNAGFLFGDWMDLQSGSSWVFDRSGSIPCLWIQEQLGIVETSEVRDLHIRSDIPESDPRYGTVCTEFYYDCPYESNGKQYISGMTNVQVLRAAGTLTLTR